MMQFLLALLGNSKGNQLELIRLILNSIRFAVRNVFDNLNNFLIIDGHWEIVFSL